MKIKSYIDNLFLIVNKNRSCKSLCLFLILFLISGLSVAFSQSNRAQTSSSSQQSRPSQASIVAAYGVGTQVLFSNNEVTNELLINVDALFIGKTGLTIAAGSSINLDFGKSINFSPALGIGYIYSNNFHIGGLLNVSPIVSDETSSIYIIPTFISGYDFGSVLLNVQASYMIGIETPLSGIKLSLGAGVKIR